MSFSSLTKNQISQRISTNRCCQMAEFLALTKSDGTISIHGRDGLALAITTENTAVAKKIFKLAKELFRDPGRLLIYKNTRLKKNNRYEIRIPYQDDVKDVFIRLGIMDETGAWSDFGKGVFPMDSLTKDCCKRSYLRGAFLGSGSVNNPEGAYHLEIVTPYKEHAEAMQKLTADFKIDARICKRKNQYVLYLKNADQIVEFLINIGAHQALLSFENERIKKGIYNNINRQRNFDLANLEKTVTSSVEQVQAIRKIEELRGLDSLSPSLQEAAVLRKENPDLSLTELAALADPPVGKSGMSHRLKKLREIAEDLA